MSKDFWGTVFNLCDELRWSNYRLLIVERSYFRCLEIWRLGGLELEFESGVSCTSSLPGLKLVENRSIMSGSENQCEGSLAATRRKMR